MTPFQYPLLLVRPSFETFWNFLSMTIPNCESMLKTFVACRDTDLNYYHNFLDLLRLYFEAQTPFETLTLCPDLILNPVDALMAPF